MKCHICDNDNLSIDSSVIICTTCKQLSRSDLFSKILTTLLNMYSDNKGFDAIKDKCGIFSSIIKNYPVYITPFGIFDPDEHDTDRIALHYLRTYVLSEDNNILQKHQPIKIDISKDNCLYKTIAILCRLDIEEGTKELRVRNVIDMVLNAEIYHSADPELHSCLEWGETWRFFVLEQLCEKQSMNGPNTILTLSLHSLSSIMNIKIRSVYPKVPGGNDDLRKRFDRIFSPLDAESNATTIPTITILWSNTKPISSHCTSSMWLPDCVIPLLPKSDCYSNDIMIPPRAKSADLQNPAERSFYILSCFCPVTQGVLNEFVSYSDQEKHSEAEIKKEDAKIPEFRCPKCSKICNNYGYDWRAVHSFRQHFTGARLTYILVDITSSMTFNLLYTEAMNKKSSLPRIIQTKEAIKELLREIAAAADPLDQVILTTFDNKLKKSALIPLCNAVDVAKESNLTCIDAIELSPRSVQTHFYSVLKEVYEMLEREPFLYIDLYLFSDGVDTSPKKNDKTYQAIIRGLNEKIGAKCHFMNCGSASEGFSVAAWLGDADADCPMTGSIDEIKTQVKIAYKKDHERNPNLTSVTTRNQGKTLDISRPTSNSFMTDEEARSIRIPRPKAPPNNEPSVLDSAVQSSNLSQKNIDDYLANLPSTIPDRSHSATTTDSRSRSPTIFKIATRHSIPRKFN